MKFHPVFVIPLALLAGYLAGSRTSHVHSDRHPVNANRPMAAARIPGDRAEMIKRIQQRISAPDIRKAQERARDTSAKAAIAARPTTPAIKLELPGPTKATQVQPEKTRELAAERKAETPQAVAAPVTQQQLEASRQADLAEIARIQRQREILLEQRRRAEAEAYHYRQQAAIHYRQQQVYQAQAVQQAEAAQRRAQMQYRNQMSGNAAAMGAYY